MKPDTLLEAKTTIALAAPLETMAKLRDHFEEHGAVSGTEESWRVEFGIGTAEAKMRGGAIHFLVSASDATSLSYLQWGVAEHVCEFAAGETPEILWQGGVQAGGQLPYFREMRVMEARRITPRMRRLTLAGDDLERFSHDGIHVRLLFAPAKGVKPVWPVMAADGRQAWPEGPRPVARVYTIRRIDVAAGEIDVDFVLHEGDEMPGARFAVEARPGDIVGMTGPGGLDLREADHYVLLGDESALPAIGRMLEELPAEKQVTAFVEIADDAERQHLFSKAKLDPHWLSRQGRPAGSTTLLADALRSLDIPAADPRFFVWAGCEHAAAKAIRAHLRDERQLPRRNSLVAAYWRLGRTGEAE